MDWIKLHCKRWFTGSTRWELEPAERLLFVDLLALTGMENPTKGYIEVYAMEQLSHKLMIPMDVLQATLQKLEKTGKIRLNNNKIYIEKWFQYNPQFKEKKDNSKAKDFIAKYCESFKALYGKKYYVTPKDAGIAKRLCDIPDIEIIMDRFFNSKDKFIVGSRHSMSIISSQINKLMVGELDKFQGIKEWLKEKEMEDGKEGL